LAKPANEQFFNIGELLPGKAKQTYEKQVNTLYVFAAREIAGCL